MKELLIALEDFPRHKTQSINPALLVVASRGHNKCVKLLLEYGAGPDVTDQYSNTAIILASERGCVEVVRELLEHGCDTERLADK